jgi:hypothetical protein
MSKLDDEIGDETRHREHKEFFPNINRIDKNERYYRDIIDNHKWDDVLEICYDTLRDYINVYIAKYVFSFINNKRMEEGEINIGVSDDGYITGIPIDIGKIDNGIITEWIRDCLSFHLKDDRMVKMLMGNIEVEIIILENEEEEDLFDELLGKFKMEYDDVNRKISDYKKTRKKWSDDLTFYKRAIAKIINEPQIRDELISFIKKETMKEYIIPLDVRDDMIKTLRSKEDIIYEEGQLVAEMKDKTKIAYWITEYRDFVVNQQLKKKPKNPVLSRKMKPYTYMFQIFRPIVKKMVHMGIKICMIKITTLGGKHYPDLDMLGYYDKTMRKTRYPVRQLDKYGNPCSV